MVGKVSTGLRYVIDITGTEPLSLGELVFEFKKKGIVVGKVKVMANCRKKPRQIVHLSGLPSQGILNKLEK